MKPKKCLGHEVEDGPNFVCDKEFTPRSHNQKRCNSCSIAHDRFHNRRRGRGCYAKNREKHQKDRRAYHTSIQKDIRAKNEAARILAEAMRPDPAIQTRSDVMSMPAEKLAKWLARPDAELLP